MIKIKPKSKTQIICKVVLFCATVTGILKIQSNFFPPGSFYFSLIGPIWIFVITYIFLKVDRASFKDVNLKVDPKSIVKFCIGFLSGIALISILIFVVSYASDVKIQSSKHGNLVFVLLQVLPAIILLAFMEEVAFRGYPLVNAKNRFGKLFANRHRCSQQWWIGWLLFSRFPFSERVICPTYTIQES
jgi:membrane protease YdiL (CAAX protease family)